MDLPTLSALEGLPTFTPSADSHTGLELLAAAASAPSATGDGPTVLQHIGDIGLNKPGPFNPAATLAPKVAKKILDLEFVEMAEVTIDAAPEPTAGRPFVPSRPPDTNISQWTERFAAMAALLSKRYPAKAPELFAYLATVVRAERNYEAGRWAAYDRQFRREALARKSLDWSMPDPRLYSEAFTGRATGARCASWTTTWLTTAHGAPASRGADGFLVCRHGHHPQQCRRAAHATLAVHLRCAGGLTRVAAECQHAVTCTHALAAVGSTQSFRAAETADRTDLHLELHPPRAGLMQGGPVTDAPNGEGQQD